MNLEDSKERILEERERIDALISERDFSLLEQLEAEIEDLDRALKKLDEGTYGLCEACGEEISADRLAALPGTRFCVRDAAPVR